MALLVELISEKGTAGEVYNISGDKAYKISDIIEIIRKNSQSKIEIEVDSRLLRPTDEPVIFGDSTKIKNCTGWSQQYTIEKTIIDMLEYWRKKISI